MEQGKSTIVDNLISTRLENLIRFEVDFESTGSAKPGITRITGDQLQTLRRSLHTLGDSQSLVCDIGGTQFSNFMTTLSQFRGTTSEFDRIIFVMRSTGIKEGDALDSIADLIEKGADPSKVSVIFNFEPYTVGLESLRSKLRSRLAKVFESAEKFGFHVCETPIIEAAYLYTNLFNSRDWTVDDLDRAPDFKDQIRELVSKSKDVPEALFELESWQENARSFAKPNLDAVWSEILSASNRVV